MCGGLTLTLLSLAVGLLLCGQRTLCQLLPDLSDPCASSATQVHDNDIAYFPPSLLPQNESPSNSGSEDRKKRGATSENRKLWPNGVVYYTFSSRFNAAERRQILEAMKHWEDHTCIRFKHRSNQPHYVNFFPGAGCCSYVGRIDYGRQPQGVSIGRSCFNFHPIVHEIGHVVGFWHEQSRPDRDEYIDIIEGNIVPGYETNFQKIPSRRIDSQGVGYDYNSIMHYDSNFFSRNPFVDTLRAKDPSIPVGKARVLSELDIEQTNRLYTCDTNNMPPPSVILLPLPTPPPFPTVPYSCVEHLMALKGSFQSPGYPLYEHNTDCVWMIKVADGYTIQLIFDPIELENTYQCVKDYIKVFDNLHGSGDGQVICAYYNVYNYRLQTNTARIHYHSDHDNDRSHTLTPLAGFRASYKVVDIDECVYTHCSHSCRNLPGSYECRCPRGFFLSADGHNCFDMNECALGNGGCDHQCVNTGGSFSCGCRPGYKLQADSHSCRLEGTSCSLYNGGCEHICSETPSNKICSCRSGYKLHSNRRSCIDDNECHFQRSGCRHVCTNTHGSYVCSCHDGFKLDADQHNCLPEHTCSMDNGGCDQLCRDTSSGAVCSCRRGYRLATNERSCQDIDECSESRFCQDICTNTNGSFVCSCSEGLTLDHNYRTCSDINECLTGDNTCPFKERCINYFGTYRCSCPPGYHTTPSGQGCEDQDECAQGFSAYCSHTCRNIPGSFQCECPPGYVLQDLYTCRDADECISRTDECNRASGATCQNLIGSYLCKCPDGYIMDDSGRSCIESLLGYECEYADECDEGFVCAEGEGLDYMTCQCPPGFSLSSDEFSCNEPLTTAKDVTTMVQPIDPITSPIVTNNPITEHSTDVSTTEDLTASSTVSASSSETDSSVITNTLQEGNSEEATSQTSNAATIQLITDIDIPSTNMLQTTFDGSTTKTVTVTESPTTISHASTDSISSVVTAARPPTTITTTQPPLPSTSSSTKHITTNKPMATKQASTDPHSPTNSPSTVVSTKFPTTNSPTQPSKASITTKLESSTEAVLSTDIPPKELSTISPLTTTSKKIPSIDTSSTTHSTLPSTQNSVTKSSTIFTAVPSTKYTTSNSPMLTTSTTTQKMTPPPSTKEPSTNTPESSFDATTLSEGTMVTNTSSTKSLSHTEPPSQLPGCGGHFFEDSGSFNSTNWPETYPVNIDCEWTIELPDPSKIIELSFNHFVFGLSGKMPECKKDWIKVYDGHSYDDDWWGPLCSFWKPDPIKTTSHRAMIVFHSGPRHNKSRKGFRLMFSSVDRPTITPPLTTTTSLSETDEYTTSNAVATTTALGTTAVTGDNMESSEDVCTVPPPPIASDGLFQCYAFIAPGTKFGPPRFPLFFDTHTARQCHWILISSSQKVHQLRFLYFDLPSSLNCSEASLKVYSGFNTEGDDLATFCGDLELGRRTLTLGSSHGVMTAVLKVNAPESCSFRGFHAVFEEVVNP